MVPDLMVPPQGSMYLTSNAVAFGGSVFGIWWMTTKCPWTCLQTEPFWANRLMLMMGGKPFFSDAVKCLCVDLSSLLWLFLVLMKCVVSFSLGRFSFCLVWKSLARSVRSRLFIPVLGFQRCDAWMWREKMRP